MHPSRRFVEVQQIWLDHCSLVAVQKPVFRELTRRDPGFHGPWVPGDSRWLDNYVHYTWAAHNGSAGAAAVVAAGRVDIETLVP